MKGKKEARGQRWDTNAMAAHVDSTLSLFHAPYLPPPTLLTLPLLPSMSLHFFYKGYTIIIKDQRKEIKKMMNANWMSIGRPGNKANIKKYYYYLFFFFFVNLGYPRPMERPGLIPKGRCRPRIDSLSGYSNRS